MALQLPNEIEHGLASINQYQLAALKGLCDELRRDAYARIKPPMTLDQYGAAVGAMAVLNLLISEIERAMV